MTRSGDAWRSAALPGPIIATTRLRFAFGPDGEGEIRGIGLDPEDKLDEAHFRALAETRGGGPSPHDGGCEIGEGRAHFETAPTEGPRKFDRVTLGADDAAGIGVEACFRQGLHRGRRLRRSHAR